MPTYDYECSACGETTEYFQSITAEPKKTCPECGKDALQRQIGAGAGFIFKGSGFYITDYRSADYKAKAKADAGGSSSSSSSGSDKSSTSGGSSKASGDSKKAGSKKKTTASATS